MQLDEFEAMTATIPYVVKGIYFSELFLFLRCCEDARVEFIVESGISHGLSSRVLNAARPGRVLSIDLKPPRDYVPPRYLLGDGAILVPEQLILHKHERVAVLIDGPKGQGGRLLRDVCLTYPSAKVVATHDQPPGLGETYHSHDEAFQQVRDRLDAKMTPEQRRKPKGPGLGVWMGHAA